ARAVGDGLRHRVADAVLPRVQRESRAIQRGIADRYSRQEAADDATGGAAEVILNVRGVLAFARGVAHLRAGAVGARRAGQAAIDDRECNHQLARLLQAPAGILEIAPLGRALALMLRPVRIRMARLLLAGVRLLTVTQLVPGVQAGAVGSAAGVVVCAAA